MDFAHPFCFIEEPAMRMIKESPLRIKGWVRAEHPIQKLVFIVGERRYFARMTRRRDVEQTFPGEWCRGFYSGLDLLVLREEVKDFQLNWRMEADGKLLDEGVLHVSPKLLELPTVDKDASPTADFERESLAHRLYFDRAPMAWLDQPVDRKIRETSHLHGWVRLVPEDCDWELWIDGKKKSVETYDRPDVEGDLMDLRQLPGIVQGFTATLHRQDWPKTQERLSWSIRVDGCEVLAGLFLFDNP
jgi:hypothetical protein